jgi:hypothetical protein
MFKQFTFPVTDGAATTQPAAPTQPSSPTQSGDKITGVQQ